MQATIPTILHSYTVSGVDALGMATLEYTDTDLQAYWLLSQSNEPTDPDTTDHTGERAALGVPPSWPTVTPRDRITVADRVWAVDGQPVDYSLGPFTDLWIASTGEAPATVIHLMRDVD